MEHKDAKKDQSSRGTEQDEQGAQHCASGTGAASRSIYASLMSLRLKGLTSRALCFELSGLLLDWWCLDVGVRPEVGEERVCWVVGQSDVVQRRWTRAVGWRCRTCGGCMLGSRTAVAALASAVVGRRSSLKASHGGAPVNRERGHDRAGGQRRATRLIWRRDRWSGIRMWTDSVTSVSLEVGKCSPGCGLTSKPSSAGPNYRPKLRLTWYGPNRGRCSMTAGPSVTFVAANFRGWRSSTGQQLRVRVPSSTERGFRIRIVRIP